MDNSLLIVDYAVGNVGSVHDSVAFAETAIYKNLAHGEWMLADAAYPLKPWCITPFKKPTLGTLTRAQRRFNYFHSRVHVQVKCAIGLLKGRWQSLREVRIQVKAYVVYLYFISNYLLR